MSLSRNRSRAGSQSKQEDSSTIYQRIRRIDGAEVIRKYYKCGLLGKGGFANCFITQNSDTKQKTATKIVLKEELRSHRTRLRLANEIKLHKALHHQNVVQLYHCFEDRQHVYIFLELCQNQSLNELIKVRGTFLTPEIQSFMFGIVNGLKYIHNQKIIHRDLKLGNIFVDGKLNVKIGDFGLATKLQFNRECKRTVCGTPNYIAPEVLDGRGYHFEVDIWSIGVILYTLYYGVPPFETEEANSTYQRIKECSYMIPKSNTPSEAVSLIQKILVRNPADRPTLDQILQSDFMKLGQGILKELPLVCSKKAPTKKQLNSTIQRTIQHSRKSSFMQEKVLNKEYVTNFDQILEDTFYYELANDDCGVLEKGVRIIYKKKDNNYMLRSLSNNYEEQAPRCDLKFLLMSREQRFNVLDEVKENKQSTSPSVFLKKVQKVGSGWVLKLSNRMIQYLVDGSSYLIWGKKIWDVSLSKQKQISLSKLRKGQVKGNSEHLQNLAKIINEIEQRDDLSKDLKENSCLKF